MKSRYSSIGRSLFWGTSTLLLASSIAEASGQAIPASQLETMVVTATREEKRKMDIPESVDVFDEESISSVSPSHPSEILNRSAGVHINNMGGEGHMTAIRQPITTRGVYLFLEDGVPVRPTGFFNHNALYEVNIPQSGRLEVTKGPGSALYGSDAIGGIINSISAKPPESAEAMINIEAGSHNWQRALLSAGTTEGRHGVNINLNISDNEGYRDESDYSRASLTGRWDIRVSDDINVKTLFSYTEVEQSGASDLEEFDYLNNPKKNRFQGDTAFRDVEALRLSSEFSWLMNSEQLLTLTPYIRHNTMTMAPSWMITYDPSERESSFKSFGLLSKFRSSMGDSVEWIAGLDIDYTPSEYQEEALSHTLDGDIYTGYRYLGASNYDFDALQTSLSPYVQLEAQLTENLLATFGIRYDYFDIEYDSNLTDSDSTSVFIPQLNRPVTHRRPEDQTLSFSELSPKLGLVYQVNEQHTAYFNFRQAFSIPSVGTLFRSGSTQNSDELDPIRSDSFELGFRGQARPWLFYEIALYRMEISDDLVSIIDGFERNVYNAGETRHQGIELTLRGNISESLSYSLAFTKTEQTYESFSYTCCFPSRNVDVSGNDVGKAPESIGNLTLAYVPSALPNLRVELEWEHMGRYFTDETNTSTYPGHDLFNLRARYTLSENTELYTRLQNLSDERYSNYTSNQVGDADVSYRPGLPRSVYAGVKFFF